MIRLFILSFVLMIPLVSMAGGLWSCEGQNIESLTISQDSPALVTGAVSWDCFPGGGICNASASVQTQENADGDIYFRGNGFWMVIHTSSFAKDGSYKAHIIAKDLVDAEDQGGGMNINEFLGCHSHP